MAFMAERFAVLPRRAMYAAILALGLLLTTGYLFHQSGSSRVLSSLHFSTIKETNLSRIDRLAMQDGTRKELLDPRPEVDFAQFMHLPPAHMEQFARDRRVFATLYCSRGATARDPFFAATQQVVWRLLWSPYASTHPVVVFVCPFIDAYFREVLAAQGAWVIELPLLQVLPDEEITIARWTDMFVKLNMWNRTEFDRIVYLDTDAFPIANVDDMFDLVKTQSCKTDQLGELDRDVFRDSCDYVFGGVSELCPTDHDRTSTNGGVLVLQPDERIYDRLVRNARRTSEYDTTFMEQALLNSNLGFGYTSPFPVQDISPIYNFNHVQRRGCTVEGEDPSKARQFPVPPESIRVIHDKLWLDGSLTNRDPLMPFWNEMWSIDWIKMCRMYDSEEWQDLRRSEN